MSQEIPDKRIKDASTFMGIDVRMTYPVVASTIDKKCSFLLVVRSRTRGISARIREQGYNLRELHQLSV